MKVTFVIIAIFHSWSEGFLLFLCFKPRFGSHIYSFALKSVSSIVQVLLSEARILGLGPRFMSIYIQKLAVSNF